MALSAEVMAGTMLGRGVSAGLSDQPPHFALSRVYRIIAEGVIKTLIDPIATIVTTNYLGPPATGFGTAGPIIGLSNLDPERFHPNALTGTAWTGPFSAPFFSGIGGVIEHIQNLVTLTDLFAPVGTGGTGTVGGIVVNADTCVENMKSAATADNLMVVRLGTHVDDPAGTFPDPVTQEELSVGDLFSQAQILLTSVAAALATEMSGATKPGIPVTGAFVPLVPPITGVTITALLS